MTYYRIIFNNMKRNFKNYYIYIMSTIFSVLIFYLFSSIKYNKQMGEALSSSGNINAVFIAGSSIILIFSLNFVWASNSFFVKNRKKEIALYSLLGLKKKKIGRMLFVENMMIASISLIIGIFAGTIFSKLFIMILLRMVNEFIYVEFVFSMKAARDTIIFFMLIFIVASINSYRIIYKVRLIELFASSKKREKSFKTRPIIAIISLVSILYGYYLSQHMVNAMFIANVFIVLGTVIAGTYGLFSYFITFSIKILKKRKKTYYKGNNILAISNISYRIKSHTVTLATIAILSASTVASLGMVDSVYYDFKTQEKENYPFSFNYKYINDETNNKVFEIIKDCNDNKLVGSMKITKAKVKAKFNVRFETAMLKHELGELSSYYLISNREYNKMMDIRSMNKKVHLQDNECIINYSRMPLYDFNKLKGHTLDMVNGNDPKKELTIKNVYRQCIISNKYDSDYIIVSDKLFDEQVKNGAKTYSYYGIKVTKQLNSKKLSDEMYKVLPNEANLETFYYHFKDVNETVVTLLFVAFFVGIVFLLSTGSIIYFKLITEANEEKDRYAILRKIGVSKKDISWSIKKQVLTMFVLPLSVGLIHSAFALKAFNVILNAHILKPVIITMIGYSIIYFAYYYLTINYYKKIILKNK